MTALNAPDDEPRADELAGATSVAQALLARQGLDATAAAIVALLDALDRRGWAEVPLDRLVAAAGAALDAELVSARIVALEAAGVIAWARAGFVLDPGVRDALRGGGRRPAPTLETEEARELGRLLARPGAAVVLSGGTAELRRQALERAVVVRWADSFELGGLEDRIRTAWFGEEILAVEAGGGALDWIDAVIAIPVRLAVGVDASHSGEALARLRAGRAALPWIVRSQNTAEPSPLPAALAPLSASGWSEVTLVGPAFRVVRLAGTAGELAAAGRMLAAHLGEDLPRIDVTMPGAVRAVSDVLRAGGAAWLERCDQLGDELAVHALAGLISASRSIVVCTAAAGGELPGAIAGVVESTLDCGGLR